jgi:eukaryotic-like serine/threonine-protein kinase
MLLCRAREQNTTCNTPNRDGSQFCQHCGRPLQSALYIHDAGVKVGRYRILRLIDHGSFGAVYEAEVVARPDVHVALKASHDPENIPEFATGFAVLSRLRHPNLPRYYEMFEHAGVGFLPPARDARSAAGQLQASHQPAGVAGRPYAPARRSPAGAA